MSKFSIRTKGIHSRVLQIVNAYKMGIEQGKFSKNEKVMSIKEFSEKHGYAKDTVEKAYNILRNEGYIAAIRGKGYFIEQDGSPQRKRVLLIFNKLSSYKKIVYDAFIKEFDNLDDVKIDLHVHHYNPRYLEEILDDYIGLYDHYLVMPHFFYKTKETEYLEILNKVSSKQLILLDKRVEGLQCSAVYQDFELDIYEALTSAGSLFHKYNQLVTILHPDSHHPIEIIKGISQFCSEEKLQFSVIHSSDELDLLVQSSVYLVLTEEELVKVLKKAKKQQFTLGKDIGIISFNETALKEFLNITVVTTDFEEMGRTAAKLVKEEREDQVRLPYRLIKRESL